MAVLQQASEDLFGRGAAEANKKAMTKLPAKVFVDFSCDGALSRILYCALRYKNEQGWKAEDLEQNLLGDATKEKHLSLYSKIEKDLINAQLLRWPKVFFSPDLRKEVQKPQISVPNYYKSSKPVVLNYCKTDCELPEECGATA